MKAIRLILLEDNRLLREGINAMLQKEPDIEVAAVFNDDEFGLELLDEFEPDILLMDIGLSNQDSLELVKAVKCKAPALEVIVMYLDPAEEDILRFIEAGVSGFILKDATFFELANTIRRVASGEKTLPTVLAGSLFSQIMEYGVKEMGISNVKQSIQMTNREREVVNLISEGMSNKEISNELNISIYTVKSHVHNILEKLALSKRVQIVIGVKDSDRESKKT